MTTSAADLASRFGVAGAVEFAESEPGLVKAVVSRDGMTGELFLQGAQVTAWQPPGAQPVVFISSHAVFATGKAIRGGVPVIFPWFGPHPTDPKAPQHGFARTAPWQLDKVEAGTDAVTFDLSLASAGFDLTYRVSFGAALILSLVVRNSSQHPASFEEALHSYFAVSDVERVAVSGLESNGFTDKTANSSAVLRPARRYRSPRRPTASTSTRPIASSSTTPIGAVGSPLTRPAPARRSYTWNPWPEKAAAMADLGADNWRGMIMRRDRQCR